MIYVSSCRSLAAKCALQAFVSVVYPNADQKAALTNGGKERLRAIGPTAKERPVALHLLGKELVAFNQSMHANGSQG